MRKLFITASGLAALGLFAAVESATPVRAEVFYPWCASSPDGAGIVTCSFDSMAQCRATVSGVGGRCLPNGQMRDTRVLQAPQLRPTR